LDFCFKLTNSGGSTGTTVDGFTVSSNDVGSTGSGFTGLDTIKQFAAQGNLKRRTYKDQMNLIKKLLGNLVKKLYARIV
jgi:hypothetical protein